MNWDKDSIVKYLIDDYCRHNKNYQKYLTNDNEVDANWESAVCDYIFTLLATITGRAPSDLATKLEEELEGIIIFDPQQDHELLKQYLGKSFFAAQDIVYCSVDVLYGMYDEEDINFLTQEVLDVSWHTDEVTIVKGTRMTYIINNPNGFPVFEIHGFEFDFAGEPFKLKPIK